LFLNDFFTIIKYVILIYIIEYSHTQGLQMSSTIVPTTDTWDAVWEKHYDKEENTFYLEAERISQRWHHIKSAVEKNFQPGETVKVLEIGAGRGTVSLLLGREFNAEINILDFSDKAIEISKDFYKQFDMPVKFIKADALNLPEELLGRFDIIYSGGLIEHFEDPSDIVSAHFKTAKKKGLVIISVPNALCLPYRIYKFFAERSKKFDVGFERPFSFQKLKKTAVRHGVTDYSISGTRFIPVQSDLYTFIFRAAKKLTYKLLKLNYMESFRQHTDNLPPEKNTPLRKYLAYALTIIMKT